MRYYGRTPGINKHFKIEKYRPISKADLPGSYSFESFAPGVFDQGQFGSCVANATAAIQMLYSNKRKHDIGVVSRAAIYSEAKYAYESDDVADDGLAVTDGLLVPKAYGFVAERDWPYPTDQSGDDPGNLLKPVPADLWKSSFDEANYLTVDTSNVETMMRAMVDHGPLVIGLSFAQEFEDLGPDGFMDPDDAKTVAGGHCVYVPAFDQHKFGGSFRIRNSWSTSWGANGDGWLPFDTITKANQFWPDEAYTVRFVEPTIRSDEA